MKLFVMVRNHSWSISVDDFRTALLRHWPDASTIERRSHRAPSLDWRIPDPDVYEGHLTPDGEALVIAGQVEGCSRVAVWFRTLVPAAHTVTFFDEGYNGAVDVMPNMTSVTLTNAYTASLER